MIGGNSTSYWCTSNIYDMCFCTQPYVLVAVAWLITYVCAWVWIRLFKPFLSYSLVHMRQNIYPSGVVVLYRRSRQSRTRLHKIRAMWLNEYYWARARPSRSNCCHRHKFPFFQFQLRCVYTLTLEMVLVKVGRWNEEYKYMPRLRRNRMIACVGFIKFLCLLSGNVHWTKPRILQYLDAGRTVQ